jgi:outer membrane biosynthesis protein TonB
MRNQTLLLMSLIALLGLLLFGCSLGSVGVSEVTLTPTKTLRPVFTSTLTPTATEPATETPVPNDTPVATDTPVLPTEAPTTEPPAVTDTPLPAETPLPTDSAPPTAPPLEPTNTTVPPTNTAAPPTSPPPAQPTNTTTAPTNTPQPGVDFRVQEIVAFEDGSLSASGLHNIYFTVLDANGAPLDGIVLKEVNNQPAQEVATGSKGPGKAEFTMWAADYRFEVDRGASGAPVSSETTHVLSVLFRHAVWDDLIAGGICSDPTSCEALGPIHYSYNVTFQRAW